MSDAIIRKIAVIFVADVVGFSKMMEANEDETLRSFRACLDIMENLFAEHGGRIFNTAGDAVLARGGGGAGRITASSWLAVCTPTACNFCTAASAARGPQ